MKPDSPPAPPTIQVIESSGPLQPATAYRYRIIATNSAQPAGLPGPPQTFTTTEAGAAFALPDHRAWELVSPVDKNGGAIQGPGQNFGGDVLQAAADGEAVTYSSSASFGEAQGAPPASQYLSRRGAGGWSTENISPSVLSGSYGDNPDGVPYQLFSPDLSAGLMLNGEHCRGSGSGCPVENPPLPGSGAPVGYQDYYLRDDETGAYTALLTAADAPALHLSAEQFELSFAGASPDLRHIIPLHLRRAHPRSDRSPTAQKAATPPKPISTSGVGGRSL